MVEANPKPTNQENDSSAPLTNASAAQANEEVEESKGSPATVQSSRRDRDD